MAQSSMHIGAGSAGSLWHNSREKETENSIFRDEKNECDNSAKEAFSIYREELQIRSEKYTERTGQKLQKKAITHLSGIVNLNANHTMEDLNKLKKYLEDTLDTKVFQMAIHRDEGHIDENGKPQKNYHAHIEFMGLDSEGKSVRKKLTKKTLSELQTKTAEILKMERGINYAKERKHRPKRLDTYEYKAAMKHKEEAVQVQKLTVKQVKAEMEVLRREMASAKQFSKEDYQILSKLKKQLKKNTIPEIYAKFQELQKEVADAISEKQALEYQLQNQNAKVEKLENVNAKLEGKIEELSKPSPAELELRSELEELQEIVVPLREKMKELGIEMPENKGNSEEEQEEQTLEEQVKKLRKEIKMLTKAIDTEMYARESLEKMQKENAELQTQNNSLKGTVDALQEQNKAKDDQILALEQKTPNLDDFDTQEIKKELDDAINTHFQIEELHQEVEEEGLFKTKKSYEPVEKITTIEPDTFFQKVRQMATRGTAYMREKFDDLKEKYESLKQNYENLLDENFELQYENGVLRKQLKEKKSPEKETPKYSNELNTVPDLREDKTPKKKLSNREALQKLKQMQEQMVDFKELQKKRNDQKTKTKSRGYRQR